MITTEDRGSRMRARLDELQARLEGIEEELDAPLSRDAPERAVELEDDEVLEGLGRSGQDEMRKIRAALARIEAGTYGFCTQCGNEIAAPRLDAMPWTPFCRECAP
jgi:RNA polymerase-binding transcription factor DksA